MPKSRKKKDRKVEKRVFILCEGAKNKSENSYLKFFIKDCNLPVNKVEVKVIDSDKNTGKELVEEARTSREFDEDIVWVVYDKDGYTKHRETFILAEKYDVKIAFSSISFEYWILLHYKFTSKQFRKSEDIINYIKKKGYIDYSKKSVDTYFITRKLLSNAKKNAKRIQNYQLECHLPGTPIYEFNPYTNLDKLIEEIESLQIY